MSLRDKIHNYIRNYGSLSYQEMEKKCNTYFWGKIYKVDTARRQLENSPFIEKIFSEKGAVTGYKWKGQPPKIVRYKVEGIEKYVNIIQK